MVNRTSAPSGNSTPGGSRIEPSLTLTVQVMPHCSLTTPANASPLFRWEAQGRSWLDRPLVKQLFASLHLGDFALIYLCFRLYLGIRLGQGRTWADEAGQGRKAVILPRQQHRVPI